MRGRIRPAGVATAIRIDWAGIVGVRAVLYIDYALGGKQGPVSGVSRGHDAVKHIDSGAHTLDEIFGGPNAHDIAGRIGQGSCGARRFMTSSICSLDTRQPKGSRAHIHRSRSGGDFRGTSREGRQKHCPALFRKGPGRGPPKPPWSAWPTRS